MNERDDSRVGHDGVGHDGVGRDDLLDALANVARERASEEPDDPRWDSLTDGTLSADDEAALRALAEASPEDLERFEAFRPLDDVLLAKIAEDAVAKLEDGREARQEQAEIGPWPLPATDEEGDTTGDKLSRERRAFRRRRAWRWARGALPALAAAAALVIILRPKTVEPPPDADLGPLPSYAMEVSLSGETFRSGDESQGALGADETVKLSGDKALHILLRPATRVTGPLAVRIFRVSRDGSAVWPVRAEVAAGGAVRLDVDVAELDELPPGPASIVLVVGRPSALPQRYEDLGGALEGPGWRVLRRRVVFEGGPTGRP